jgi:hypothetical protein
VTASTPVDIGNIDDDPQNADWLLNANKAATEAGFQPAEDDE